MNILGASFLFFGYDLLKKGITGNTRTSKEGVGMTHVPDLASGLMLAFLGVCFWLGSFVWF